jgi:3',5'-cyclic AMP phosphodiesterase CpdA
MIRAVALMSTLLLTGIPAQDAPPRLVTDRPLRVTLPMPLEDDAFQFAVLGDRTSGPPEGVRVLAQAVGELNLLGPDLVLTVGDLIQGYTHTDAWLTQMREYRGTMADLRMPWFPVAGNHDTYWGNTPERPRNEHDDHYEEHFGPLWYAFSHKGCWFVVLYSDEGDPETGKKSFAAGPAQQMTDAQFRWLEATLERAQGARHVFVFLHHPRWIENRYDRRDRRQMIGLYRVLQTEHKADAKNRKS